MAFPNGNAAALGVTVDLGSDPPEDWTQESNPLAEDFLHPFRSQRFCDRYVWALTKRLESGEAIHNNDLLLGEVARAHAFIQERVEWCVYKEGWLESGDDFIRRACASISATHQRACLARRARCSMVNCF